MNTRERILSIKLMERQKNNPKYFKGLGVTTLLKERATQMNARDGYSGRTNSNGGEERM